MVDRVQLVGAIFSVSCPLAPRMMSRYFSIGNYFTFFNSTVKLLKYRNRSHPQLYFEVIDFDLTTIEYSQFLTHTLCFCFYTLVVFWFLCRLLYFYADYYHMTLSLSDESRNHKIGLDAIRFLF